MKRVGLGWYWPFLANLKRQTLNCNYQSRSRVNSEHILALTDKKLGVFNYPTNHRNFSNPALSGALPFLSKLFCPGRCGLVSVLSVTAKIWCIFFVFWYNQWIRDKTLYKTALATMGSSKSPKRVQAANKFYIFCTSDLYSTQSILSSKYSDS